MTRLGRLLLRNKHDYKPLTHYLLLWAIITGSALPHPVLAFESTLPSAPAQKFVAHVTLQTPDYSERLATQVQTQITIEVQEADWPAETRLALAKTDAVERVYPSLDKPFILEGEASYYSRVGCLGCSPNLTMANGQPLNDAALTMAIGADRKHLVGRTAKVTSLTTGQSVEVRITDTGGFYKDKYGNRVADLTIATKEAIGMRGGVGQVRIEVY